MSSKEQGFLNSFLAGGAGGMCLVFVGHPLDTVKVKLQTTDLYKGTWDCIQKTVKKDGLAGLYRGMAAPITGVTPMYAMCFAGYGFGKQIFCDADAYEKLKLEQIAAAGAFSAAFTTPILAPGERLKCILQIQADAPGGAKFKGPMDLGKHLWKEAGGGVAGLRTVNRGFFGTFSRDAVASAWYFSSYEYLKAKLTPEGESSPGAMTTLFCGGTAGILNWAFAIPLDNLKSKLQTDPKTFERYPNGCRSVAAEMYAANGFGALTQMYRGFTAVMLRAFPANAACFLGYETAVKFLNGMGIH
eukprot:TRINITY_DN612_c1_g5_i1.p1 TRINITY_DN612_c1_g5~~TRINITY_DN612_c1_g5_i1.p1  ORF type:complete len:318 (+),score=142.08 TRINITY_DN612_c1_g5_i1:52-954(+)